MSPCLQARENSFLRLEVAPHGGHVGFVPWGKPYYSEQRVLEFMEEIWN